MTNRTVHDFSPISLWSTSLISWNANSSQFTYFKPNCEAEVQLNSRRKTT